MSHFLELPGEVLSVIIDNLSHEKASLLSLCLVGSHVLLDIARSLTWLDVGFDLDLDDEDWSWSSQQITEFVANPRRASGARSVRLRVSGSGSGNGEEDEAEETWRRMKVVLRYTLGKFTKATHVYLSAFELNEGSSPFAHSEPFVDLAVQFFPALTNLYVDGYLLYSDGIGAMSGEAAEGLMEIVTRYCSPTMAERWSGVKGLEVVEFHGGNGEGYYWAEVNKGRKDRKFFGYDSDIMGTGYVLNESMLRDGKFDRLTRLHIVSELEERVKCLDIDHVVEFFNQFVSAPLPSLTDIVLRMPFTVTEYHSILASISIYVPYLKRLMMELEEDDDQEEPLGKVLEPVLRDVTIWKRMEELEEIWLPVDGGEEEEFELINQVVSNLKSLIHLHLAVPIPSSSSPSPTSSSAPSPNSTGSSSPSSYSFSSIPAQGGSGTAALECKARKWAEVGKWLRGVGWDDTGVFEMRRDGVVKVVRREYVQPEWIRARAIGEWWV